MTKEDFLNAIDHFAEIGKDGAAELGKKVAGLDTYTEEERNKFSDIALAILIDTAEKNEDPTIVPAIKGLQLGMVMAFALRDREALKNG